MDTILGLLGIVVWVVGVISLAAAITFVVVKVSRTDKPPKDEPEPAA
jgi:hypothetical protein